MRKGRNPFKKNSKNNRKLTKMRMMMRHLRKYPWVKAMPTIKRSKALSNSSKLNEQNNNKTLRKCLITKTTQQTLNTPKIL
jgi:hypothetical protein